MNRDGSPRAWSWVEHLRAGGTTPWAHWNGGVAEALRLSTDRLSTPRLPGAQQLELLRRVNLLDPASTPAPLLADRVLAASAFGRGRGDLPLSGVTTSRFGPPSVDPAALRPAELLRVAVLMLADDLADAPIDPAPGAGPGSPQHSDASTSGRRRAVRRGWRLAGDPWVTDQVRAAMRSHGHRPGGRRSLVHVVAGPVDRLLADVWTHRCLNGPERPWPDWVAHNGGDPGSARPAGADVAATAATWTRRVGPGRVVVVTNPASLPRMLGVRALAPPATLGAEAVELARQVAVALDVVVEPGRRPAVLRAALLPLLLEHQGAARPLRVPASHDGAVCRRAERQRDQVRQAGYAVRGDVEDLLVSTAREAAGASTDAVPGPTGPEPDGVLDLAGRLLLARARPQGGGGPR